jgi:16S rRNA (guanine(966)-N(2))-methyltransferase RsmD
MRIISGIYRGRQLRPPGSLPVRPTTDYAKEGLFNVLNNLVDYESLKVLDLFTGTGSIAFEFLSRGAAEVVAVDANQRCVDFIKKSASDFGASNLKAVRSNSFVFIKHAYTCFDMIFADPPYDLEGIDRLPDLIIESGLFTTGTMLILEHSARNNFAEHERFQQHRCYGSVNFTFFQ